MWPCALKPALSLFNTPPCHRSTSKKCKEIDKERRAANALAAKCSDMNTEQEPELVNSMTRIGCCGLVRNWCGPSIAPLISVELRLRTPSANFQISQY